MHCNAPHVEVATSSPIESKRSSKLYAVAALLALTAIFVGCGSPSQSKLAPQSTGQLSVFVPAPAGSVGMRYNAVPSVSGGVAPYAFSVEKGSLPPGVSLNPRTGSITGVPSSAGEYTFWLAVTDSPLTQRGTVAASIVVAPQSTKSNPNPQVTVSPANTTVVSQQTFQFSASVTGTSNTAVTWSASAGAISSTGAFTAPKVSNNTTVTVAATSAADASVRATATVNVTAPAAPPAPPALAITTAALAEANVGAIYSDSLSASGGQTPYRWSVSAGSLPSGIQLQNNGLLTGTTTLSGSYAFTAQVTDAAGNSVTQSFTLPVISLTANGFDGPAELPRVYIQTAMANTPAPGSTITVSAGGNLQSALNSANCGDTVQLQAGAIFSGPFTLPAKSCDDNHWIVVRSSASDSALPAEGSRLTPCYAGVSGLPARPALNCASTNNVLPKLVMAASGNGPILFAAGANHYRLIGLEITRNAGTGIVYALASIASGGTANNLILDRVWMHGTAQDDTNRGVWLEGGTYISVIDSTLTDFHCVARTGACGDAQAIGGGLGDGVMGPYKITGNFLEASGENVLFGGGSATATPTDIQISQNHIFKPLTWMTGQPGFVGGANGNPFVVKNLFELKNAQRVLFEGNILENTWGGFSQVGFGILLTPKNQISTTGTNLCPLCQVTDVTVRNNVISHVAGGLQIANALAVTGAPLDGERYSIHDIVVEDIDGVKFDGPGEFAQISVDAGAPLLQNVRIDHVTAFPMHTLLVVGDKVGISSPMKNIVFTNSLVSAGTNPVWSTGGGPTNCAYYDIPLTTLTTCFTSSVFSSNAIIGGVPMYSTSQWPTGNYFPASTSDVAFANFNGGLGGDYHLLASSPYKNKATDGKDLGADIDAVNSAIANVQ